MKKKILFRADAQPAIGTGDIVTFINLSEYFENAGWEVFFVSKNYESAVKIYEKRNIKNVFYFDKSSSISDELLFIKQKIKDKLIDFIFLQINERQLADYESLNGAVKIGAVVFDGKMSSFIDLALDWSYPSLLFEKQYEKRFACSKFLLGFEYAPINIKYEICNFTKRKYSDKIKNILITMGGADENNYTLKVLDKIMELNNDADINIVLGAGFSVDNKNQIYEILRQIPNNYNIYENIDILLDLYLKADIAISAGGLSAFEIIATRTKSLLIPCYEHQLDRCKYFHEKKWAINLGLKNFKLLSFDRIVEIDFSKLNFKPNLFRIVEECNAICDRQ